MRIAYLCLEAQQSRSHVSGYAVHLNSMVGGFERAGHDVHVVVLGELLGHRQVDSGTIQQRGGLRSMVKRVVPGFLWETAKDLRLWRYNRRYYDACLRMVKDFRPDVIYEQVPVFASMGVRIARHLDLPRMAELHSPLVDERCRDGRRTLLKGYMTRLENTSLRLAPKIRTVSTALKEHVVQRGIDANKIVVQPNGADTSRLVPTACDTAEAKEKLGLANRFVVGFSGSMVRWHRVDTLLHSFARARETRPDLALLVVGSGEMSEPMQRLVAALGLVDSVTLTGNVPHRNVRDYYAAMDVCCMPGSNWYGSPMKLLEYGAMCKPIIAPDTAPVREIMDDGDDCLIVQSGDTGGLAHAITTLYDDPQLRQSIARHFHHKVCQSFSWDHVAQNILRHLESITH